MTFQLPEEMPTDVAALEELLDGNGGVLPRIRLIQAKREAGESITQDDVVELNGLIEAAKTIKAARDEARGKAAAQQEEAEKALADAAALTTEPEETPADEAPADEAPADDAPADDAPAEAEVLEGEVVTASDGRPVNFAGVGAGGAPAVRKEPGWEVDPSCPGYRKDMGRVGFAQLGQMLDSVRGSRTAVRPNKVTKGSELSGYHAQVVGRLSRDMPVINDAHELIAAVEAIDERKLPGGSLIASMEKQALTAAGAGGGWCAPSEQVYTFCDVPNASDLISLPDFTINRGGVRFPVEPDLSALLADFEWFFTETQMEAVDSGTGDPTAVKTCVDIPCPDEFNEIRLSAVGYCVEAGILQTQGWPELITWFMQNLAQEHLRAMSKRTILDIVAGSTGRTIADANLIGVAAAVLNSLAFRAATLRLNRGLPRSATVEAVAPAWLFEAIRADVAMQQGRANYQVTDGEIISWFTARNIAVQWVGDWQSRGSSQVGNLTNLWYPATVDIALYPAGTWFRSLAPVIELGVMYPKEQLQVNRYTRFFTEDAIAVFKRCNQSEVVTVPICVSGAYGGPVSMACEST